MENVLFSYSDLPGFERWLRNRDLADNTIRKYLADVTEFLGWLGSHSGHAFDSNHGGDSNDLNNCKRYLVGRNLAPGSANTKLCSLNSFFTFMGHGFVGTTRIYPVSTWSEHLWFLNRLDTILL